MVGDLTGDTDVVGQTIPLFDTAAQFAMKCRLAARKRLAEWQDRQAGRWALLKRPRPLRSFTMGDRIAVWRRGKGQGYKKGDARWHGPGVVVG